MGGKKPLRRPLWPPTRATASNYYPLGLDGAGGAAKPLLRAPKKPAPLHGRLPAFSGAVDAFERARKCFLEWRYFFSIILSEFLKNRVALQYALGKLDVVVKSSNGTLYYIPGVIGDIKAHTWNNGVIQTYKAYPDGKFASAGRNFNGTVCAEFIGDLDGKLTGLGSYSVEKIIFYAD